jgi:sugar transferase (PEP-CTERM system associated)
MMFMGLVATGLYQARLQLKITGYVIRIAVSLTMGTFFLAVIFYAVSSLYIGRGMLAFSTTIAFVLLSASRIVFVRVVDDEYFRRRVLVFGTGRKALELTDVRSRDDTSGFRIVGFVHVPGTEILVKESDLVAPGDHLVEFLRKLQIDEIVVAIDDRRRALPLEALLECRLAGFPVIDILNFMERETGRVRVSMLYPSWFIFSDGFSRGSIRRTARRVFDIGASLGLLILAAPAIAVSALAVLIESGFKGPIFYMQLRSGLDGKAFLLVKFRSMIPDAEGDSGATWCESEDPRITPVGRVLRKFRLDELPQIYNVLRGDMSFVGPRPERPEFVDDLGQRIPFYRERHAVKPGITGWAQVRYPYGSTEQDALEKLQYDLYYIKNQSLLFDLAILLQTAEVVLWRKGSR